MINSYTLGGPYLQIKKNLFFTRKSLNIKKIYIKLKKKLKEFRTTFFVKNRPKWVPTYRHKSYSGGNFENVPLFIMYYLIQIVCAKINKKNVSYLILFLLKCLKKKTMASVFFLYYHWHKLNIIIKKNVFQ